MKKALNMSEKSTGFSDQIKNLQNLSDEVSRLENRIENMIGTLDTFDHDLGSGFNKPADKPSNIIPFPGTSISASRNSATELHLASPGMSLPKEISDYRSSLQRNGLILLAWDKRVTETGERFTAYWVTSTDIPRFYASKPLPSGGFPSAQPDHKSYAAEDGIEFYGQEAPACIVHVAPELMMSSPRHRELRPVHIKILQDQGSTVDFNYKYLLTKEKKRVLVSRKSKGRSCDRTGVS